MLDCPNCRHPLVRCHNEFGNFWHCGDCEGTAVTVSLLRKFVDQSTMNALWQGSRQWEFPRRKDCPGCHNRMEEIPLKLPVGERHVDVCERCHFVWLDAGEWDDLPHAKVEAPVATADPVREASPELREKIALQRIERMRERERERDPGASYEWWQWLPGVLRLPVEEEQPTTGARPLATWGLAGLILIVGLLAFTDLERFVESFGLVPAEALRHGGITLVTSFFLHAGALHLLGNLYFLFVFGDNVEHFLGPLKFLFLVAAAALAGAVLHILIDPDSAVPCIGASGGISGIMAFYALRFPKARVSLLLVWFLPNSWLRLSARWMFALWIVQQCFVIWQQVNGYGNVSAAAHLGGVAVGVLAWFVFRDPLGSSKGSIFER